MLSSLIADAPFSVVRIVLGAGVGEHDWGAAAEAIFGAPESASFRRLLIGEACRGVSAERFEHVFRYGVDVEPTTAPIYVSSVDKAAEYGGWPKAVLVFSPDKLDRTFRELPASAPQAHREQVRKQFPTETRSPDGASLWYSRLRADDPRVSSGYEIAYARWIPGDAREALVAVAVVEHENYGASLDWPRLSRLLAAAW